MGLVRQAGVGRAGRNERTRAEGKREGRKREKGEEAGVRGEGKMGGG